MFLDMIEDDGLRAMVGSFMFVGEWSVCGIVYTNMPSVKKI